MDAIFVDDSYDDIKTKIKKAYCPPGIVKYNPILDYTKLIIFETFHKFLIPRKVKDGGDMYFFF